MIFELNLAMQDLVSAADPERSAMFFPVSPRQGSGSDPEAAAGWPLPMPRVFHRAGRAALAGSRRELTSLSGTAACCAYSESLRVTAMIMSRRNTTQRLL